MRLSRLFGAALGTGFLLLALSNGASAWDSWHEREHEREREWREHERDRERDRERDAILRHEAWKHEQWRREHAFADRPMVVERERPVFVPQPVYTQPMIAQPMMPSYNQQPSGLNLNFNIPFN